MLGPKLHLIWFAGLYTESIRTKKNNIFFFEAPKSPNESIAEMTEQLGNALLDPKKTSSYSNFLAWVFFSSSSHERRGHKKVYFFGGRRGNVTGRKTTQKLRNLNTEIVSSTLPRPDQAFERPQRPTESPTTPTFMPEVKARGARGGRQSDEVSKQLIQH